MKKVLFIFMIVGIAMPTFTQIVYQNSFDTQEERNAWTQYRQGDQDNHNWEFVTANPYSPTHCLYHDYPMDNGVTYVEDWLVSPALNIALNGILSVYVSQSRMSMPPDVYFGIWFSDGDKDPAGGDYVEVADLTLFPAIQGAYDDTAFQMPFGGDTAYIAFKYSANYYEWLMLSVDDLAILGAVPVGTDELKRPEMNIISAFPNPFNDYCRFEIDPAVLIKHNKDLRIEIFDHSGRKVKELIYSDEEFILNDRDLKAGFYYYSLVVKNSILGSGKLILK